MESQGRNQSSGNVQPSSRGAVTTNPKKLSWRAELSDAGLFSYAALCAITLHDLYDDTPSDKPFQEACLSLLLKELQLAQSDQVRGSLRALMEGHGSSDVSAFIDLLRVEPVVERIGLQQVPEDLVSVAIKEGCYDARMRVLIRHLTTLLTLDWQEVEEFERSLINTIRGETHQMTEEEKKEKDSSALKRKVKKYTMIGLATVGGGALLGLTGGLAAPFLAAGAGAIIGGAGAAALGSVAGVAIIGSLFGVAGAGLGGFKMNKRVGDIEEFEFETLCEEGDLHVTIAITGWITDNEPDFKSPWTNLSHSRDQYSLKFESEHLKNMGTAMDYILTFAISAATQETLKYTILSGLLAAVAWPMTVLSASSIIDNPWSVCTHRTAAAGKQLAEVLLAREQGKRPVTLVGFSLGARVVFYCLTEMAKRKNSEGIIQDAVMLGAPVTGSASHWAPFARVVSGRIVNGYCKGDWLLRFLYRTASVQFSIAGLQPIKWHNRRMANVDLSEIVTGHLDYWNKIDLILSVVGVHTTADDLVVTGVPATEGMESGDQWLVVDNVRHLPSSGIASEVTTPSSSQATDPFPGCISPAPGGRGSVSTDSGFDRDAELESMASATEILSLRPSERGHSLNMGQAQRNHSPKMVHPQRDPSSNMGQVQRDNSPHMCQKEGDPSPIMVQAQRDHSFNMGYAQRDHSPHVEYNQREHPTYIKHTVSDQEPDMGLVGSAYSPCGGRSEQCPSYERGHSPHIRDTERDPSANMRHGQRDSSPHIGHGQRDSSPHIGHGQRDSSPHTGHGQRDSSPHIGHGQRDSSPHIGQGQRDNSPHIRHGQRDSSPNIGHGQRDSASHIGHGQRDTSPHTRQRQRDSSPHIGQGLRDNSPHSRHGQRDSSPHIGHGQRDSSAQIRHGHRDKSPHTGHGQRESSPHIGHGQRDCSPHIGHGQRDSSPQIRHGQRNSSPHIGHGQRDSSPQIRHGQRDSSPHIGHGQRDCSPHIGHGQRDSSPQIRHGQRNSSPQIRHGQRESSSHTGHGQRDSSPHIGHGQRNCSPHIGRGQRDSSSQIGHGQRESSPRNGHQ